MRTSQDHIPTSHFGSLPRPDRLIAAHRVHEAGEPIDDEAGSPSGGTAYCRARLRTA
jgi:hypothetical protein